MVTPAAAAATAAGVYKTDEKLIRKNQRAVEGFHSARDGRGCWLQSLRRV